MKPVVSAEYAAMNKQLHAEGSDYGAHAFLDAQIVVSNARANGCKTVLDYGCGKGTLKAALKEMAPELSVLEFDPAIDGKDTLPEQADFIVALDVMEHIELDYLSAVLENMVSLAPRLVLLKIALTPSKRLLPDGRNAHILLKPPKWWEGKLKRHFDAIQTQTFPLHFIYFGKPRRGA